MSLGFNFNKFKNGIVLESESSQGLLRMIQEIRCPVEVIQIYFDGKNHIAFIVSEKKLIRKIKQEK
jgi:hypothetical protein